MRPLKILAVVAFRNEAPYLSNLFQHLKSQGLEVAVIDDGSTDESWQIVESYRDAPVVYAERVKSDGTFSLQGQLERKARIVEKLAPDWVLHLDADEAPQNPDPEESLRSGIELADSAGANCINFQEFVFLPRNTEYRRDGGAIQEYCDYYLFEPSPVRLLRAWKPSSRLSNFSTGGHLLKGGEISMYDRFFILRHYMFLDQNHAMTKYVGRNFDPAELAKGWHRNRIGFVAEDFRFPEAGLLRLPSPMSLDFDRSCGKTKHYWEWPPTA